MTSEECITNDLDDNITVWFQRRKSELESHSKIQLEPGKSFLGSFVLSDPYIESGSSGQKVHDVCVFPKVHGKPARGALCKETELIRDGKSDINVSTIIRQGRIAYTTLPSGETEAYNWTQTDDEVEIICTKEGFLKTDKKLVKVALTKTSIRVSAKDETLFQGNLTCAIDASTSTWSLTNKGRIQVLLVKAQEKQIWDFVLVQEGKEYEERIRREMFSPIKRKLDEDESATSQEDLKKPAISPAEPAEVALDAALDQSTPLSNCSGIDSCSGNSLYLFALASFVLTWIGLRQFRIFQKYMLGLKESLTHPLT